MPYINDEMKEKINSVDLLTFMKRYNPDAIYHSGGNEYRMKNNRSLTMSNGAWKEQSAVGVAGYSAVSYLQQVEGMTWYEASVLVMNTFSIPEMEQTQKQNAYIRDKSEHKELVLPDINTSSRRVTEYLMRRGISSNVISFFLSEKMIAETKEYHNCLFIGYDYDDVKRPKYASQRGTLDQVDETGKVKRFVRDCPGSDKHFSFRWTGSQSTVHVFEGAIDALSYATILDMMGKDFTKYSLLSNAGVSNAEKSKLPIALEEYLKHFPNTKTVSLHFDNDEAGRNATASLMDSLNGQFDVFDNAPLLGKDVNDYLRIDMPRLERLGILNDLSVKKAVMKELDNISNQRMKEGARYAPRLRR